MGRNTEFYVFEKEKASDVLYAALKDGVLHKKTFEEYLTKRKTEFGSSYFSEIDKILETVKNDINYISSDDLYEIINYINGEIFEKFEGQGNSRWDSYHAGINRLYDLYGIKLLYEVHTSTVCYSYMFQFGNYKDYFAIEGVREEDGYNINSLDYLSFNDYMILLTDRIRTDVAFGSVDYSDITENETKVVNDIKSYYQDNKLLFEVIEKELVWLKEAWQTPEDENKPEKNTIWWAELFFSKAMEIKETIKKYHTRVVILDSI